MQAGQIILPEGQRVSHHSAGANQDNEIGNIRRQIRTKQARPGNCIACTNALAYLDATTGVGNKPAIYGK